MTVHDAARGFEAAADAYERGRPAYPEAAVDLLARALPLGAATCLLDVGAGTGKLSRLAAARGARVVALDPAQAMLRRLAGAAGVAPVRALAEVAPFRAGAFDAAVAASSFHWFDGPRALAELHRVLRPDGRLALVWNRRDDAEEWVARLSELVNRREGEAPRHRKGLWRRAFEAAPGLFAPLEEGRFRHVHSLTRAGVLDRVASISFIACLDAAGREEVLSEVGELLDSHPATAGREAVELPYVTEVYAYVRR